MENILATWEAFAATQLPAARRMESLELRDHAPKILDAVAHDITQPQTREQQEQKSQGRAPQVMGAPETAAQTHAVMRARSGFNINQLTAEYRALRASVLSRWADVSEPADMDLQDLIRFNEAIDQAIAESVEFYSAQVDQARNLFLGMLGHDLRSPLSAIQLSAGYLAKLNAGENVSAAASRIIRSGSRMQALLDDLLDFNRTKLGLGISITPAAVDLTRSSPTSCRSCVRRIQIEASSYRSKETLAECGMRTGSINCSATWFPTRSSMVTPMRPCASR